MKQVAALFVLAAEELGVDEIAVVPDGDLAAEVLLEQRLGVARQARSGGGIAIVADACLAGEAVQHVAGEHFGDQAHTDVRGQFAVIAHGDARGLLPTMLLCEQRRIAQVCGMLGAPYPEHPAFFFDGLGHGRAAIDDQRAT